MKITPISNELCFNNDPNHQCPNDKDIGITVTSVPERFYYSFDVELFDDNFDISKYKAVKYYIGVSCLPLITALIINFVFGFFLPQVTLYVFIIGLLVSLVFLYDSLRSIFDKEQAPIIEISVLLLIILLAFAIVFKIAINQLDSALQDYIIKSTANGVEDIFGGIFG